MYPFDVIFEDLYSIMKCIEDDLLDCNLAEITPIRDLSEQFGACAQQFETSVLLKTVKSKLMR